MRISYRRNTGKVMSKITFLEDVNVLDNPLTQDDDDPVLLDDDLVSEPKTKSIPQQVSDYITRHF